MGFMKHLCEGSDEALLFIQDICNDGYVVDKIETIEFDHYVITYHRVWR
jgi:hypothetical protein